MASNVAIIAPGSMGAAVGAHLRAHGASVSTCLAGRSNQSAKRAHEAGLHVLADDIELVRTADIFLSIVPPRFAIETATRIATAMQRGHATPLYADCNAVTPSVARSIGSIVGAANAHFVDASIVGGPPRPNTAGPKFYVSGDDVSGLICLRDHGLDVQVVGKDIGQASALKMCYALWAKGTHVLATELLVAAAMAGVFDPLLTAFRQSDPEFDPYWNVLGRLLRWRPGSGRPDALLVEDWNVSADGRVWTLSLRNGTEFRKPYSELTSEDVKLSFDRLQSDVTASSDADEWANVQHIEALDRYTVRITFREPRDIVRNRITG